jgi:hypothetical protein
MIKRMVFGAVLSFCAYQVQAADSRYSTWSNPNAPQAQTNTNLDKMLTELRKLVDEAERGRAADPKFLQDLKSLAARYDVSAPPFASLTTLFKDDFADGDFTSNPTWKLLSGKYWVERGYGLRSFVEAGQGTTSDSAPASTKVSKEELVIGLLGAVLGGKTTRTSNEPTQTAPVTTSAVEPAEIQLPIRINNAFSITMELSSWKNNGQFEFGPYQGTNLKTGYRVIYRAGGSPALQLVRNYATASSIVDQVQSLLLEDQKTHMITLSRTSSGDMKVSVDDKVLMQKTDQSFRDDFSGLIMTNRGGDYIVKTVSAQGLR